MARVAVESVHGVEVVVDAGGDTRTYEIEATRAGRRLDVRSGRGLVEVVEVTRGGTPVRTRVGHSFIKATMAETGAIFGGEHSAHYYFRDFWGADTGMLAALHVLALAGRTDTPLSRLAAGYAGYVESGEINSRVSDTAAALDRVEQAFRGRGEVSRLDGFSLATADWRLNVRVSNTEPLLRLNVEAPTVAQVEALRDEALSIIRG